MRALPRVELRSDGLGRPYLSDTAVGKSSIVPIIQQSRRDGFKDDDEQGSFHSSSKPCSSLRRHYPRCIWLIVHYLPTVKISPPYNVRPAQEMPSPWPPMFADRLQKSLWIEYVPVSIPHTVINRVPRYCGFVCGPCVPTHHIGSMFFICYAYHADGRKKPIA